MTIPYFEVFAFTDKPFAGNPAGVCLLPNEWLPHTLLQSIGTENNLPETAFLIDRGAYFDVRWMSPAVEIELCGHATLASAHVLFNHLGYSGNAITFHSRSSGELRVERKNGRLVLDFPAEPATKCDPPPELLDGLRALPREVLKGRDYLTVFESEEDIAGIKPNLDLLARLGTRGVIVTAPGKNCDFVSRFFAPGAGIPEDPVTGSTHCALIPYWSKRLDKRSLHARQISKRGGELFCEDRADRVGIGGSALTYVEGKLNVP
jgi:PhzF family phenazine biosynthesis protein